MLHITYIQEDQVIVADLTDANHASVTVCDMPTGLTKKVECSPAELAASLALAIAGDGEIEGARELIPALYKLAEPLQKRLEIDEEEALNAEVSTSVLRLIP